MGPTSSLRITVTSLACAAGLLAQDPGAWRSFSNSGSSSNPSAPAASFHDDDQQRGAPNDRAQDDRAQDDRDRAQYDAPPPNYGPVPSMLTVQPGAFLTVRVNQFLSSDRNQGGDTFYATLAEPLIVDGVVVARRGATVMGRVSDARKAGRVEGTSSLGLQLTSLSLVDGSQVSIQSGVIDRSGSTSVGRDAAAIGTTTALGAAIGASSTRDSGTGAAIGAGAGAAAGILGVLLSRGHATEVYPESMLTFRLETPVNISTARAAGAFHYADQQDYSSGNERVAQQRAPRPVGPPAGVYARPYPSYPYYAPYYGGFSIRIGPRYYGGSYRGSRR